MGKQIIDKPLILVKAAEATQLLGVTANRFLRLQDRGVIRPHIVGDLTMYDFRKLKPLIAEFNLKNKEPEFEDFPSTEFATVKQSLNILKISRKTFYDLVAKGKIEIHKSGFRSFVKRSDLSPEKAIFEDEMDLS